MSDIIDQTRAEQLDAMRKAELRAEVDRLDDLLAAALTGPGAVDAPSGDSGGPLPLEYHIGGAPHRGTHVRIRRCAPSGEYADRWLVLAGARMLLESGQRVDAHPWDVLRPQIQRQAAFSFGDALARARKAVRAIG